MKTKAFFWYCLQCFRTFCSRDFLREAWECIRAHGILAFLCFYLGTITGYLEWKDGREVRKYRMPNGKTLADELSTRLKNNGVQFSIRWRASCYGPSAIITAFLGKGDVRAISFDYDHVGGVFVLNPLAAFLFPDLPKPISPRAYPIDWIGPEALK